MDNKTNCLNYGFTTGSCAAAAAKAAAYMFFFGKEITEIEIMTPKGITYRTPVCDIKRSEHGASCAVKKDGGDDPDVTTGALIYAKVWIDDDNSIGLHKTAPKVNRTNIILDSSDLRETKQLNIAARANVVIDGGEGVGRVTKPGLDQPVGSAAINHVPREMITEEIFQICDIADFHGNVFVEISVPGGKELSQKTFNPRLGIEGGISIIGTTGIVEPMSERALLDTIFVELKQRKALGESIIAVSPGNYGLEFMRNTFGYDIDKSIKCSNFIGDTINMAIECGFEKMLLTGHIGKLIKLSGGMMNTHSKYGDCRMELLSAAALSAGVSAERALKILNCVSTEEALAILRDTGADNLINAMDAVMDKIMSNLDRYSGDKIQIECIMYSNEYGLLAGSRHADEFLNILKKEMK